MTTPDSVPRRVGRQGNDLVYDLMAELQTALISQRLQQARKEASLTQQEMADLLLVHKRSIEDYESPKKDVIPYDRINEWARLTQTTPEWLLHGTGGAAATPSAIDELRAELAEVRAQTTRIERLLAQLADSPSE